MRSALSRCTQPLLFFVEGLRIFVASSQASALFGAVAMFGCRQNRSRESRSDMSGRYGHDRLYSWTACCSWSCVRATQTTRVGVSCACCRCQASTAASAARVLPVPVGDSSSADRAARTLSLIHI